MKNSFIVPSPLKNDLYNRKINSKLRLGGIAKKYLFNGSSTEGDRLKSIVLTEMMSDIKKKQVSSRQIDVF